MAQIMVGGGYIAKIVYTIRVYAVPIFMTKSFYLETCMFEMNNNEKYKKRLKFLLVPYIFWALISFLSFNLIYYLMGHPLIDLKGLLLQILFGHSYLTVLWFQFDIIILTLLFILFYKHFNKKTIQILLTVLILISYILQYTEINYALFCDLPFEIKYPLGRIFEVLPFACFGIILRYFQAAKKDALKKYSLDNNAFFKYIGLLLLCAGFFLSKISVNNHFGYAGIDKAIISIGVLLFFINLQIYNSTKVQTTIEYLGKYTLGVYFMHLFWGMIITTVFSKLGIPLYTIFECIIIYITCYIVSLLITKVFGKIKWIKYIV